MGKPTIADAELVLKLYELRTEETMRKARKFVAFEFWPENLTDLQKVIFNFEGDHNHYWRQVMSYWEMAASFVNHEALNEDVFADAAGELFFLFAKYKHFIPCRCKETSADHAHQHDHSYTDIDDIAT